MQGTSWPVRASIAARVSIDSRAMSRRLLGASSRCSSSMRSSVPPARGAATVVTSKRAGSGSRASWVIESPSLVVAGGRSECAGWAGRAGRLRRLSRCAGGAEGVDGVLGDDVEAVGRVGEHADAAGLDRQRLRGPRKGGGGEGGGGAPAG